jgi:hypothetical protein
MYERSETGRDGTSIWEPVKYELTQRMVLRGTWKGSKRVLAEEYTEGVDGGARGRS